MKVKLNGNDFYEVSSPFGVIDSVHKVSHTGIDLIMNTGTKLFSPVDGVISKVVDYGDKNIGKGIVIKTDSGESVIMGHLSDIKAKVGQSIHQGDFVALSGNTGRSTGSHLHLGLRSGDGNFMNPEKLLNSNSQGGLIEDAQSFGGFINEWRETGSFFQAMYGKSFFQVLVDFAKELILDIYTFIVVNGDLFFVIPAVAIMFGTFIIGKNKFSRYILPLWFAYFVSVVLRYLNCLPPQ